MASLPAVSLPPRQLLLAALHSWAVHIFVARWRVGRMICAGSYSPLPAQIARTVTTFLLHGRPHVDWGHAG